MNTRLLCTMSTVALAVGATQAHADVTVTTQTEGKAAFINVGGTSTAQIRGNKMRSDQVMGGKDYALVLDIDGRRFMDLDAKKKSALVTPLDTISDELQKVGLGTLQATLQRTSQVKKVAGYSCAVHDVNISFPFNPTGSGTPQPGMEVTMVMSGTVCLSTEAPGLADYQRFYKAAADSGFIFGDPRAAKSPTGAAQAKAYAELTRKMAEAGMALETHVKISASGDGPMAGMMAKLAASDIHTTVTQIVVGDVAADLFEIPADYKVKTQK